MTLITVLLIIEAECSCLWLDDVKNIWIAVASVSLSHTSIRSCAWPMSLSTKDPHSATNLLHSLNNYLDKNGGIRDSAAVSDIVHSMDRVHDFRERFMYLEVLKTTNEDTRKKLLQAGAWDLLLIWLTEGEQCQNWKFLSQLLELFIDLPVYVELLKKNSIPRIINRLSKRKDISAEVRNLAVDIVSIWKDIIVDEKSTTKVSDNNPPASVSTPEGCSQNCSAGQVLPHISMQPEDATKLSQPIVSLPRIEVPVQAKPLALQAAKSRVAFSLGADAVDVEGPSDLSSTSNSLSAMDSQVPNSQAAASSASDEPPSLRPVEEIFHKEGTAYWNPDDGPPPLGPSSRQVFGSAVDKGIQKRRKTAKTYPCKFRSTGLELETLPAPAKLKKPEKSLSATDVRLMLTPKPTESPQSVPSGSDQLVQDLLKPIPYSADALQSAPVDEKNKAPPKIAISDGGMFSEMLESTAAIGKQAIVRKKKSSVKQERQISGDTAKPTAYVDKIQPVYNVGAVSAAPTPPAWRPMVGDDGAMKEEPVRKRSKQNRVHWASDDNLVVVHYFESETDEHELVNTCREKYGCDLKHYEMLREREALQAAKKNIQLAGTTDDEVLVIGRGSYRLMPLDDVQRTGEVGRESEERAQFKKSCAVALHEVLYIENALPPTPSDNGIDRNVGSDVVVPLIPLEKVTREHMTATKPTSSVNELPSASYRRPAEMVPVVLPSEVPLQQSGYVDPASSDYCRPSGPPYGVPPTVRPETSTDVVIYSEPYAYRQPIPEAVNLPGAMNPMHPRMPFTRPPSLNVRAPPTAAGSMYPPPATGEGTSMRSWSGPPSGLLGNAPMAPIANQSGPQFSGPSRCRFPNVPQQGVPYRRYPPPPSSRGPFPRQPFRDVTTGKPPCHFFQQGRCGYGVRCRFPHVLVDDPALSGCRPAGGPPPIRSGEFPGSYGSAGDWAPEEPMEWDS
uniref:Serine/threonine-protein phosphatase 1 regulatory subunit 10 n=1 Tax=Trichuris muris TaxID=70415 RepID=A0A5S6QWR3_TRIMR